MTCDMRPYRIHGLVSKFILAFYHKIRIQGKRLQKKRKILRPLEPQGPRGFFMD
jgi:hypothetical protein